jgi:hypothetical protein
MRVAIVNLFFVSYVCLGLVESTNGLGYV